jgi:hypothetical protein
MPFPLKAYIRNYAGVRKVIFREPTVTRRSKNVQNINKKLADLKDSDAHPVKKAHKACVEKFGVPITIYTGTGKKEGKRCPSIYFKSFLRKEMKSTITGAAAT